MKKPSPLLHKTYHVPTTNDLLQVQSVIGETVRLRYTNKDKGDVTTTIPQLERVLKLEVWKEI